MGQARRHQRRRAPREARHAGGKLSCGVPRAAENRGSAGAPFPRHAGPRIHDRARQTLHASDSQRQTHSRGRGSCGGRDDAGKAHRSRHRAAARRAGATRTIAPSATRSARAQKSAGARPAGVARRRGRRSRVQRRRGSRGDSGWAQGNPGSHRDLARGHPRDAGGGGNPDRARRDDQPCRGGGARDGQVLRGRMLGELEIDYAAGTLSAAGTGDSSRRIPDARRHRRRGYRGTRADRRAGDVALFQEISGMGRRRTRASAFAPMPTRRTTPKPRANSAPKVSGCAAPSICSSRPSESRRCAR